MPKSDQIKEVWNEKQNNSWQNHSSRIHALALFSDRAVLAETPLEGAWLATSYTDADGNTNDKPQPALYIFTATHYSIMIATGDEPRVRSEGEDITDAERVVAYQSFIANTGRYEVDGNTLKTRAFVAKSPNYMGDWPENERTVEFEVDGDQLTIKAETTSRTFRQVEGSDALW